MEGLLLGILLPKPLALSAGAPLLHPPAIYLSDFLLKLPVYSSESEHGAWPDSPGWFLFEGLLMSHFNFLHSVLWHVGLRAEDRLGITDMKHSGRCPSLMTPPGL